MLLKDLIYKLVYVVFRMIPHKKNKIVILENSYPSGSNTKILYDYLTDKTSIDVTYIEMRHNNLFSLLKKYFQIARHQVIISTHGFKKFKKNQILINLWHGIPLKSMNYMVENQIKYKEFKDDYLITNSKLESILLSSCMFVPYKNHKVIGSPRLEYFNNVRQINLNNYLDSKHVIIYLPTFRTGNSYKDEGIFTGNLFNTKTFDHKKFDSFLKQNDIKLLVKYHQNEINKLEFDFNDYSNIININDEFLIKSGLDIYEVLPHTDMLITDYSSVYIDYLHLNKPIIFVPTDLEEYKKSRGLLLEPYSYWTPGDKVVNQSEIERAIINNFKNDFFKEERSELYKLFFQKNDYGSLQKLELLIYDILNQRFK